MTRWKVWFAAKPIHSHLIHLIHLIEPIHYRVVDTVSIYRRRDVRREPRGPASNSVEFEPFFDLHPSHCCLSPARTDRRTESYTSWVKLGYVRTYGREVGPAARLHRTASVPPVDGAHAHAHAHALAHDRAPPRRFRRTLHKVSSSRGPWRRRGRTPVSRPS